MWWGSAVWKERMRTQLTLEGALHRLNMLVLCRSFMPTETCEEFMIFATSEVCTLSSELANLHELDFMV